MKFRRLLLAFARVATATPSILSAQAVVRADDRVAGRPGRVAVVTADGGIAQVEAVVPVRADGTVIEGGGGGGSSGVAQGSTTAGQSGGLTQAAVVSGDQTYTAGTTQPLNLAASGRLKVGTSYSGNITPNAILSTTTSSAIVGCQYRASPATWQDTWTGSLRCDNAGRVNVNLENPLPAGTNALGSVIAGGSVAGGAASAGNPVPIGCDFITSPATVTTGQRITAQCTARGGLHSYIVGPNGVGATVGSPQATTTGQTGLYVLSQNLVFDGTNFLRATGDANGAANIVAKGTATLTSGQVSVGTTATQIVAAQAGRGRLTVTVDAAVKCYIGPSGVTTTTGYPLQATAGASHTMNSAAAVFMVCASTATIGYIVEN